MSMRSSMLQKASRCYYLLARANTPENVPKADEYSTEEVYYVLTDDIRREGFGAVAKINSGIIDGLYPESAGVAYGADTDDWDDRDFTRLGQASIIQLDSNQSYVYIDFDVPDDEYYDVYEYDYVLLYSRVPVREYRSIWMDLAMQNIFFYDQNNNPRV